MHALLTPDAFGTVFAPLVGQRVGYVRPIGNVGDRLIELAMTQLFARFGIAWRLVDPTAPPPTDVDLLVFGGGGNMGTLYRNNYELRTRALALGLPLVVLPQSFTTPENRGFTRVHVRERGSLALHPAGILAPDLALGLDWPPPPPPDRDLGLFLRRDGERTGRMAAMKAARVPGGSMQSPSVNSNRSASDAATPSLRHCDNLKPSCGWLVIATRKRTFRANAMTTCRVRSRDPSSVTTTSIRSATSLCAAIDSRQRRRCAGRSNVDISTARSGLRPHVRAPPSRPGHGTIVVIVRLPHA